MAIDKSLCDLGASINLMPLAMMKELMIEELKPTRMSLQLVDRSLKIPNGVVENLLVKVGNFIFPADFVVLDMDEKGNNSVILGRPFLATARRIIDVEKCEMIFRVHDEQMTVNVFKVMQYPNEKENCMRIDVVDILVEEVFEANHQANQEETQGQRKDNKHHVIYYARKVLNEAQKNYTTTKKELLPVDAKPRLIRWILLLQEFDIEIKDRKGSENQVTDHLSRLPQETSQDNSQPMNEIFSDEHLLQIQQTPWFAEMANYKAGRSIPQEYTKQQVKKLLHEAKLFLCDEPFLFKRCPDGMIKRCVPEVKMKDILWHCHNSSYGGHFGAERTAAKVLQSGFYWPSIFKDAREFLNH
ncbi:uncharacterized protein LOC107636520 [Arachis ipaensis]|uniref:uncharacterized protein LOC107636520 n=1 Tax=Arachis ipaensis TaxID=130454 RepID=UPI0007AF4CA5|nr:uncharacterized protein LOC107636520 [Arachis ipaensis]